MFVKYDKTYRIKVPQFDIKGKFFLPGSDTQKLLNGQVVIQEKMDGANVGIIGAKKQPLGFRLQKRGSLIGEGQGTSEHEQFNYFINWAHQNYQALKEIPDGWVVYAELMFAQHNIFYDKLPSHVLVFDVWDGNEFLEPTGVVGFCERRGLHHVPMLYFGPAPKRTDLVNLIPETSKYGTGRSEGIVVKNWKKQMRGKVVDPTFSKEVDESDHWTEKALAKNKLADLQPAVSYIFNR